LLTEREGAVEHDAINTVIATVEEFIVVSAKSSTCSMGVVAHWRRMLSLLQA
jgi:hypothetical protein